MKQKTNTINGSADVLARQWERGRLARIFASLSPVLRRATLMLLFAVMSTMTARAQNTLKSHIDYCKAGVASICIAGWVYDNDPNTIKTWELGHGIDVFAFISTDPNEVYEGYFPIPHDDMDYIMREDVNATFGLNGKHGFRTIVPLLPNNFQDDEGELSERTFYVKIYVSANFGNGTQNFLMHSLTVTVRKILGEGLEDSPYKIFDADDWNTIADVMADNDIGAFFSNGYYQLVKEENEYFDIVYDNTNAVTKMFGTATCPFTGHFDGNGQTLNVALGGTMYVAPFAYTNGAVIQNLTVAGIVSASQYAGGIVGYSAGTLNLQNCVCSATISNFQNYAGGILGWCDDLTLNMLNCLFKGSFSPSSGGKYHPIALKDASATVTTPFTAFIYYLNTIAPSEELDGNIVMGAKGFPVNATEEEGVWDNPVVAADGVTYFGVHFNGKQLPYSYGFETSLNEDGWMRVDCIDASNIYHFTPRSGLKSFEFYYHWTHAAPQYLISPQFDELSSILLSFYYSIEKNTSIPSSPAAFQVGYSTTYPEIDAFTWVDRIDIKADLKGYNLYERLFPIGTKYIAIKQLPLKAGSLYLDDFSFTVSDNPPPMYLNIDKTTEYTASVTWESPQTDKTITGYGYQYKKASETEWSAETTVTTNSATITGLSSNTYYDFRVKALYEDEEESIYRPISFTTEDAPSPRHLSADMITEYTVSLTWEAPQTDNTVTGYAYQYKKASEAEWSAEATVTTTSVTITGLTANTDYNFRVKALYGEKESIYQPISFTTTLELPYAFGFENGMERWSMVDCDYDGTADINYLTHTGIRSFAKHYGEVGFQFNCNRTKPNPQYIVSPRFSGTVSLFVQFYYKDSNPSSAITETFCVGYSTTTSDISAFKWLNETTVKNQPWRMFQGIFPASTKYVAVKYTSPDGNGLFIDDFYVDEYSEFPKPGNIDLGSLTDTEATLTWTAPEANVAGYAYQYRKTTDDTWSAETTTSATTATLSGLTENTDYQFRVKAISEDNTASNYVIYNFTTEGGVVSLPYTDGFENGMGGWRLSDGDPSSGIFATSSPHGGKYNFYFHRSDRIQYLISPRFPSGTPIMMTFYCRNYDNRPDWFSNFRVGYEIVDFPNTIIQPVKWIIVSGAEWTKFVAFLPAETERAVICYADKVDLLYLDDFSFTAVPQIDLADNADNGTVISDYNGEIVYATLQGRTLYRNGEWNTLTLPFNVSNFMDTPLAGATVKTLNDATFDNGTLTLSFSDDLTAMDAGKPYIVKWADAAYLTISSEEDWNDFAASVEDGNTYAGKTVKLGADISTSTMVGTAEHPFGGIFDGAGKTITFNISNGGEGAAPFHYINGATIRNLTTTGQVTGGNYSAGLVGFASGGTNIIHNCLVETDINVSDGGYRYVGGILGNGTSSTTTIRDCISNGCIYGHDVGMIYGWGDAGGTHTIENCLHSGLCYGRGSDENYVIDLMLVAEGCTCNVINCYKNQNSGTQGTYVPPTNDGTQLAEALGDQWSVDSDKDLVIKWKVTTASYTDIVNPVFKGVTISNATANVETDYADFIGTSSPFTSTEGLLFDEHNPNNGACHVALRLANLNDAAFDGWYTDAELTTPVTTIPFAADGTVTLYTKATKPLVKGDVNGDGKVTPADAIMILYHYFGVVQTNFNLFAADVNHDTKITPADAIEALYKYFGASAGARSSSPANSRDPE